MYLLNNEVGSWIIYLNVTKTFLASHLAASILVTMFTRILLRWSNSNTNQRRVNFEVHRQFKFYS